MYLRQSIQTLALFVFLSSFLVACGEEGQAQKEMAKEEMTAEKKSMEMEKETMAKENMEKAMEPSPLVPEPKSELKHDVVPGDEIYKGWPYQEEARNLDLSSAAGEVMDKAKDKEMVAPLAGGTDAEGLKPYEVVDGKISANAIEGWKTYNGGGCGACHGKGGSGGVGPNLGVSVTEKLSEDEFKNIVTNGKPGTLMRAHKTNKRVMDNLDNLHAYLVARGDDVLGSGNLIKSPLGK